MLICVLSILWDLCDQQKQSEYNNLATHCNKENGKRKSAITLRTKNIYVYIILDYFLNKCFGYTEKKVH